MPIDAPTVLALELRQEEIARCKTLPYPAYLSTPWWNFVHDRTIKRARGLCELCGQHEAREAHHTTYERIGEERPDDMMALCRRCHQHVTDSGLGKLSRRDLLRRRREIVHSPEFQRAERGRLEY
jgi:5-methylcytosine-specific restriction endonuclease McrA